MSDYTFADGVSNKTYYPDEDTVVRVRVLSVPESEKFPDCVKYRPHYGTRDDETIIRYDNSHGVHDRHTPDGLDEDYDFPGYEAVFDRFFREIPDIDRE